MIEENNQAPDITWNSDTKQLFRDGQPVPSEEVEAARQMVLGESQSTADSLWQQFTEAKISLQTWYEQTKDHVKMARLALSALEAGGFPQLKEADYRVIEKRVLKDFEKLRAFAENISETEEIPEIGFSIEELLFSDAPIRKTGKSLARRDFKAGMATAFASNFAGDRDLHRGLALRDRENAWGRNDNEGHKHYQGKECVVLYKPAEIFPEEWWSEHKEAALAALDRRFCTIRNDLTADIIDVMFHHWRATKNRNDSPTAVEKTGITLRQICQYRGIEPKGENIRIAYLAIRDVRAFRLKGGGIDAALFDIDTVKIQPSLPDLWQSEDPPRAETGFIYSPGFFLSKAVDDEPVYFAPYVQKLWELDPKYHAKAKRFARYLRGEWRLNTQKYLRPDGQAPTRWRAWRDVLADAGIDFESDGVKNPSRFIESIREAIEKLFDIEAIRECGAAIYHPEDRAIYEELPRKGVLEIWLSLRVCIEPPAEIRDALLNTNKKRIARTIRAQEAKALPATKRKGRPKKQKDG